MERNTELGLNPNSICVTDNNTWIDELPNSGFSLSFYKVKIIEYIHSDLTGILNNSGKYKCRN